MSPRWSHGTPLLLAMLSMMFSCMDLPLDPSQDQKNASIRFFLNDGGNAVAEFGSTRKIGLEIKLPSFFSTIRVHSECTAIDTQFAVDSSAEADTVWFNPRFNQTGLCVIHAEARYRDPALKDKTDSLAMLVQAETAGIHFIKTPSSQNLTAGITDTLLFVTSITGGAKIPADYLLSVTPDAEKQFFTMEYSQIKDTVRIIAQPSVTGSDVITLIATTSYNEKRLADTSIVTLTVINNIKPAIVKAPKQIISGKADSLVFAVDNSSRPDPLTITLITAAPLDPAVFSIVPTASDSIVIAISPATTTGSATIGIITSNGTQSDTSWYPVTLVSPEAALWSTTALTPNLVEGTPFSLDLSQYLSAASADGITLTSDIGAITGTTWNFTPAWGCAPTLTATITSTKGDMSLGLVLALSVAPGDAVKPVITLVDPTLDGRNISSPQITVECKAVDAGAGIAQVVFTSGAQTVSATPQGNDVYSGVITGLADGVPTSITITATDKSRAKNSETLSLTVTRDSTMLDGEAPVIVQTSGPKSAERVKSATGTMTFTINDNSGVDSVWYTLNDVFVAALPVSNTDAYTLAYTLTSYGENAVKLYAKDGAAGGNKGSQAIMLDYNTEPSAIMPTTPAAKATGVSTSPTFKWSGGDDADGDGLTVVVHYGTSQTALGSTAAVSGKTATVSSALEYNKTYYWQVTGTSASTKYPDEVKSGVSSFTTEGSLPTISIQPQPQSKEEGQSVTFSVTASANGFGILSYQWRENGSPVGTNSNSYTIPAVTTAMSGKNYDCVVTNDVGSTTSNKAALTVSTIPTFTVKFVTDGGLPKPNDTLVVRDTRVTQPLNNPVRSGYRFTGWYELNATHDFYFTTTPITADLTIYAGWKKTYMVTYHKSSDESGTLPNTAVYDSGTVVTVSDTLSKNGYNFKGWTTNQDGSGTAVTSVTVTKDVNLYPKWEEIRYTITYSMPGGAGSNSNPNSYSPLSAVVFTNASLNGYIFDGWYTSDAFTTKITSTQGYSTNLTVYGRWIVAYGTIDQNGNIISGSGNFDARDAENPGYQSYHILVANHPGSLSDYTIVITPSVAGCSVRGDVYINVAGEWSFDFTCGMPDSFNFTIYKN